MVKEGYSPDRDKHTHGGGGYFETWKVSVPSPESHPRVEIASTTETFMHTHTHTLSLSPTVRGTR